MNLFDPIEIVEGITSLNHSFDICFYLFTWQMMAVNNSCEMNRLITNLIRKWLKSFLIFMILFFYF